MAYKRFFAYVIDMFIVFLFIIIINKVFTNPLEKDLSKLNQLSIENVINKDEYFNEYKHLLHEVDKKDLVKNISTTILLIVFFVLVPYCFNSQTIGQKIFKLKICSDEEVTLENLIFRSVILNGIGYMLFMFIILFITNDNLYFILINLLAFLQLIVVIISGFMVLYSYKHLSIADIFTNTRIEELK